MYAVKLNEMDFSLAMYLRLFGIPVAILLWIVYRRFIKKKSWKELIPDLQAALFVAIVWFFVFGILLK